MGECINTVMAIIFDAEFHHSKIIQDSLPLLAKDAEKFTTCCEGVIYEFREKRKPGLICYRHNEIKKTDLVRATFNGYIQLWEELFEADLKNKPHLLPKGFYKKLVERNIKQRVASERDGGQFNSLQQIKTSGNINDLAGRSESIEIMNSSFHIRKKRGTMQLKEREKEELIGDIQ